MMNATRVFFNSPRKVHAWLLTICFSIYFFYFHKVLLSPNAWLSSITSDALKNYYTYVYHIINDRKILHFEGTHYPFGEHVVYTDCQPLLTFILRLLPFTHHYLAGILHLLIFFSYVITPLIIYKIFRHFQVSAMVAFFSALAIALLSPQFWRLDGHFALTYECVIPLAILLLLRFFKQPATKTLLLILLYNSLLFLIHPYLGLGVSLFCFLSVFIKGLLNHSWKKMPAVLLHAFISGLLPLILFKLFLWLSDPHLNRTNEPYGIDISIASVASVFVAGFGPFEAFMKKYISSGPQEFEGLAYLGFFTVLLTVIFVITLPFLLKKLVVKKELSSLMGAALLLLLFAFGLHNRLTEVFHTHVSAFDQFRSLGRFAWFFYYVTPIFLITVLYSSLANRLSVKMLNRIVMPLSLLFFALNLLEAHYMFNVYAKGAFNDRNIFREEFLTAGEKQVIRSIRANNPQAIITLPEYYIGSEVYDRIGTGNSILPSMIYSFHTAKPIVGGSLSRTSITETEDAIELFNPYKNNRKVMQQCSNQPFLVLKTNDELMPDEERVAKKTSFFYKNDTLAVGYISKKALLDPALPAYVYRIESLRHTDNSDSSNVFYIHNENRRPFLPSMVNSYENIFVLDSNRIQTGRYVVSLHYYFTKKTFKGVSNQLIIASTQGANTEWKYLKPLRLLSGFYNGFAIFEYAFDLEKQNKYEFLLKGGEAVSYRISDFLLRPNTRDVLIINQTQDTLINNFPTH